jgi:carbon monoxide dehydrogenase subunit G
MRIAGEATLQAPVARVWDALLDPAVLVRTIPGCERLETTGDNIYEMTVTVGVAAIRGTYAGSCSLRDLEPHSSLVLSAQGAGTPGTIAADVQVRFEENPDGSTTLSYDADTVVGGMIGGVGQRMLTSVSRRLAAEFFASVEQVLTGAEVPAGAPSGIQVGVPPEAAPAAGVFTAPPRASASSQGEFLKGVAVGAGLVLAGVLAGGFAARRRT